MTGELVAYIALTLALIAYVHAVFAHFRITNLKKRLRRYPI
jgi:hypothetical protein